MKTGYKLIFLGLIFLAVGSSVSAQQGAKPWTEWSEKEARKLIEDSAWAKSQTRGDTIDRHSTPLTPEDLRHTDSLALTSLLTAKLYARFLSAQPVRQAFARLVELKQKPLDTKLKGQLQNFVDRKFDDWIVIAVDHETQDARDPSALRQAFANLNKEALKRSTYLELKNGQRLMLQDYQAPANDGLGAKFIFPRLVNGQPFLTSGAGEVRFYVEISRLLSLNIRFKVSEMYYNGSFEY